MLVHPTLEKGRGSELYQLWNTGPFGSSSKYTCQGIVWVFGRYTMTSSLLQRSTLTRCYFQGMRVFLILKISM